MPRQLVGELMDEPGLDPGEHQRALRGLARLNAVSLAARPVWGAIRDWRRAYGTPAGEGEPVRLLDVASGSGDVVTRVCRLASGEGVRMAACACDIHETANGATRARAARLGLAIETRRVDACREPLGEGFDVVTCSLFLHHLCEGEGVSVLRSMREACAPGGLVVVSDLARSRAGLALAWLGSRTLTRSRVVRIDAMRSVRAGWSQREVVALFEQGGMCGARVRKVWPERWLAVWEKPRA